MAKIIQKPNDGDITNDTTDLTINGKLPIEAADVHDAVTVADTAEIDLTLTGQQISADIIAASIDETKLDTSVNASLDLADSAVQPAALDAYVEIAGDTMTGELIAPSVDTNTASGYKQNAATILTALNGEATAGMFIGEGAGAITTGVQNTMIGYQAGNTTAAWDYNTFIGYQAGLNSIGEGNTFIGAGVGANITNSSHYNIMIGVGAGEDAPQSNHCILIGLWAGRLIDGGSSNVFIGNHAGESLVGGDDSTFIGDNAGKAVSTGTSNLLIGSDAGKYITTGGGNSIIGATTLISEGDDNIIIGKQAGGSLTTESKNVYIGSYSGSKVAGANSTSVGYNAGSTDGFFSAYSCTNNTSFGCNAGSRLGDGSNNNIFIGYQAGYQGITGSNNILLGYDIDVPTASSSNQLSIGNLIFGTGIDGAGATISTGNIGIGVIVPAEKLDVDGQVKVVDEAYGAGWNASLQVPTKNAVYDQVETKLDITFVQDAEPTGTVGELWLDTNDALPSHTVPIRTETGAYTLTSTDAVCLANGTFTVTLPTAVGIDGKMYDVKNIGTGTITVDGDGTETIDGSLTAVLSLQYDSIKVISDGTNWYII